MTFARPKRINGRVPVLTAEEAVKYIPDESTLCVLGAGGGILEATKLIEALAERYKTTQTPKNIGIISPTGLGDRAERGISPIAQEGLVKWALCGHWGQSPRISELAEQNKIFAYNYPQGVLTQMLRASAAHQPGILSEIGLGTFVDPRNQGGKLNDITKEDLISLVNLEGKEYLYYKTVAPNVAFIRATTCDSERVKIPLNQRKVVARRALYEMKKGAIGNVGVGIADGIGLVAREEGCDEDFVLTVETGPIGGITTQGVAFGANVNTRAILDMTAQFDFYHGGGLDVCYLSFAEVDQHGNVNVHKFNGKIMGTGGFIDISATSRKIVFCGTLTAGGLKTEVGEGSLRITQEGRVTKFVESLPEITFSGKVALERGLDVRYITERAVFTLKEDGLHLIEVAPGVDIERDVCSKMAFRPIIDENLKTMDPCLFTDAVMGFKLPDGE